MAFITCKETENTLPSLSDDGGVKTDAFGLTLPRKQARAANGDYSDAEYAIGDIIELFRLPKYHEVVELWVSYSAKSSGTYDIGITNQDFNDTETLKAAGTADQRLWGGFKIGDEIRKLPTDLEWNFGNIAFGAVKGAFRIDPRRENAPAGEEDTLTQVIRPQATRNQERSIALKITVAPEVFANANTIVAKKIGITVIWFNGEIRVGHTDVG